MQPLITPSRLEEEASSTRSPAPGRDRPVAGRLRHPLLRDQEVRRAELREDVRRAHRRRSRAGSRRPRPSRPRPTPGSPSSSSSSARPGTRRPASARRPASRVPRSSRRCASRRRPSPPASSSTARRRSRRSGSRRSPRCGPRSAAWRPRWPAASSARASRTTRGPTASSTASWPTSRLSSPPGATRRDRPMDLRGPSAEAWSTLEPQLVGAVARGTPQGGAGRRGALRAGLVLRSTPACAGSSPTSTVEQRPRGPGPPGLRGEGGRDSLHLVVTGVPQRWTAGRDLADVLEHLGEISIVRSRR